jgi:hypothetical protein
MVRMPQLYEMPVFTAIPFFAAGVNHSCTNTAAPYSLS